MSDTAPISENIKDYKHNGLSIEGPPQGLEHIYDYEAGGHHPVHLNDVLNNQYKVIHKLGYGGYANVWLCSDITSDSPQYVAVKILMAEVSTEDCAELRVNKLVELGFDSERFCLPLAQFEIKGPNGLHYCFVFPVLGPRVSTLQHVAELEDPSRVLRKICLGTTQAMAALHAQGICHGDFRPANIVARISGLDSLSEEDVLHALREPRTTKVVKAFGRPHRYPTAPQYLVRPIDWNDLESSKLEAGTISDHPCVIDFGESYEISNPPPDLGIPQSYCSPEYTLERKVGIGSDIWALGCTLFEIRTGRRLFDAYDDDQDEYLWKLAMILGKLPEPWWSTTWERREDFFENDTDADGHVVEASKNSRFRENICYTSPEEARARGMAWQQPQSRSLQDAIAEGFYHENPYGPGGIYRDVAQDEAVIFADLLARVFKYEAKERITAKEALEHPWFHL